MEFVIVKYPESRDVFVDEQVAGRTGETLQIETGHHRFTLGDPPDYAPPTREVTVAGTNPIIPMEIEFAPVEDE